MKIQKKIIVAVMCLSILATTIIKPIEANAETLWKHATNLTDIILTKTGIVAEESILRNIETRFRNNMRQAIIDYDAWLTENNIEDITIHTFNDFVQDVETDSTKYITKVRDLGVVDENAVLKYIIEYRANKNIEIDPIEMTTGSPVTNGSNVNVTNELADYIRELFDEYSKTEGDYYYIKTMSPQEINPLWFETMDGYKKVFDFTSTLPYIGYLDGWTERLYNGYFSHGYDNEIKANVITYVTFEEDVYFLSDQGYYPHLNYKIIDSYNSNWENTVSITYQNCDPGSLHTSYEDAINDDLYVGRGSYQIQPMQTGNWQCVNYPLHYGLTSSDGRYVKVYNSLEAIQLDSLGRSKYYISNNYGKYTEQDNSIKVSGDYVLGDYKTSHDTIQEQINNSGTITNESVSSIVNDYSQTIINNYASSVLPETDDKENDNDGGGGLLDGLGGLIGGVTDFLGFIFGLLGDAISLVTSLFNTIFEGIKALGSVFTGFTGLLGDLFGFIPSELINFLVLAVEAGVAIALWKQFKK